tara:strand:+ start:958 stop:1809 length:852 start_codon:yes stop_codon:yes gene_type:complete
MKWFFKIFFFLSPFLGLCQSISDLEENLIQQLELVQVEKNYSKSIVQNETFKALLKKTIERDDAFEYPFDSLSKFMSTITSPDGYFRLFNWNIELKNQKQHYECWILLKDKKIIILNDYKNTIPNIEFTTLGANNWFGALYFDIIPVNKNNKTVYTLLGWDGNDMFSNKKVIECLTFNKKDRIQLGNSIFNYPDNKSKKRVIFQYNKDSYMSLKHHHIKKTEYIVFDHLSPTSPNLKDFPDWYVTDLSFDAFKWENNQWNFQTDFNAKAVKSIRKPFNDPNNK